MIECLKLYGIKVFDLNEIDVLQVYVDGVDEIDVGGVMIKGGGGVFMCEKIVVLVVDMFVCIVDGSKCVLVFGVFLLLIEVVLMVCMVIGWCVIVFGGVFVLCVMKDGVLYIIDNGNEIIDVKGLQIVDLCGFEVQVNVWLGVVMVGLFVECGVNLCLFGMENGVEMIVYLVV